MKFDMNDLNFENIFHVRNARIKSLSLATLVIVIAIIVTINIIADVLYRSFPSSIDLTADRRYTLSDEMEDFIRSIDTDVTINIISSEEHYTNNFAGILRNPELRMSPTADRDAYAHQALTLLRELPRLNNRISLRFIDPDLPEMAELARDFPEARFPLASKFITRDVEIDGETITRHRTVTMTEILALDVDQFGSRIIAGSNFETEMSNALHIVTLDRSFNALGIISHDAQLIPRYIRLLERNNFVVDFTSNILSNPIEDDVDMLIISSPGVDYTAEEIQIISDFLYNDGFLGRSLIYIADIDQPELPNLEAFLLEWGIAVLDGTIVETNPDNFQDFPERIIMESFEDDLISGVDNRRYFSDMNRALAISDNILGTFEVESLIAFERSAVMRPFYAEDGWRPNPADSGDYHLILKSTHTQTVGIEFFYSHVVAISSSDFINSEANTNAVVANLPALMSITNYLVGAQDEPMFFAPRAIGETSFAAIRTQTALTVVRIIFVFALPVMVVVAGIVVFVRRKNL